MLVNDNITDVYISVIKKKRKNIIMFCERPLKLSLRNACSFITVISLTAVGDL